MRAAAVERQRRGSGLDGTGSGRLWQRRGCALGIRTVVAQATTQAQGTDGAHDRGGSGSREAGGNCGAGQTQGTTQRWCERSGMEMRGGGGGGGGAFYKSVWVTERSPRSPRAAGCQISL